MLTSGTTSHFNLKAKPVTAAPHSNTAGRGSGCFPPDERWTWYEWGIQQQGHSKSSVILYFSALHRGPPGECVIQIHSNIFDLPNILCVLLWQAERSLDKQSGWKKSSSSTSREGLKKEDKMINLYPTYGIQVCEKEPKEYEGYMIYRYTRVRKSAWKECAVFGFSGKVFGGLVELKKDDSDSEQNPAVVLFGVHTWQEIRE